MKLPASILPKYLYVLLMTLISAVANAQPGSGGDPLPCDPDAACPIDNWILLFVLAAVVAATFYLYRQKKSPAC